MARGKALRLLPALHLLFRLPLEISAKATPWVPHQSPESTRSVWVARPGSLSQPLPCVLTQKPSIDAHYRRATQASGRRTQARLWKFFCHDWPHSS